MMTRLEANIKILDIVKQLACMFPDMRFNQLLINTQVVLEGKDQFYEESEKTLDRLRNYINTRKNDYKVFEYVSIE